MIQASLNPPVCAVYKQCSTNVRSVHLNMYVAKGLGYADSSALLQDLHHFGLKKPGVPESE